MKRTRPSEIKALLAERDILPSRVLGQNFLVDQNILDIILASAHVAEGDGVLEIGPGLGVLTEPLLARARQVVAIEKDRRLHAYLQETFGGHPRLELIQADALDLDLPDYIHTKGITHVVSNLPYSAGTRILVELIHAESRPLRMVVMLQSDVAERLVAGPGTKAYGSLSIQAQLYYDVVLRKQVSPSCFYPPPEVRSALVEFYRLDATRHAVHAPDHFRALIKWCFSQRRKQIGTILHHAPASLMGTAPAIATCLETAGLTHDRRPESIAIAAWCALSNALTGKA